MTFVRCLRFAAPALILCVCLSLSGCTGTTDTVFVSPSGDDTGPGTKSRPFATITRAQEEVRTVKEEGRFPDGGMTVRIAGGVYRLDEPLMFGPGDGGDELGSVGYRAEEGAQVIVSGGRPVTGWTNEGGNRWTVTMPAVRSGEWFFRQLFAGDERLTRARTPNSGYLLTAGPLSTFSELSKNRWGGFSRIAEVRRDHPDAFCGFRFEPGDIGQWDDWRSAEVITYHSWECSWQTIRAIDTDNRDLHFNTPCRYPIGFFSDNARYRVENVAAALDEPGEWFLNRETGVLTYLARPNENPNTMDISAPVLEKLVIVKGEPGGDTVRHIAFNGISFRHTRYPMGIYDVAQDWPATARAAVPDFPTEFPPGYTDSQASPRCGEAIRITDSDTVTFWDCEMTLLGASAVRVGERCYRTTISECDIHNLGGGGVYIGLENREVEQDGLLRDDMPWDNAVSYCTIHNICIVHPSAVAVWIAQSHHNYIAHNEIYHTGYSGISMGWTWSRSANYSDNNMLEANHIHDTLEALADGGGIYTLGRQDDSVIRGNYIHDIGRAEGAIGSHNNGIFFDESTSGIQVSRNVIEQTSHTAVRFNRNTHDEQIWEDNCFEGQEEEIYDAAECDLDMREDVIQNAGPRK
jgi:hypothetical protein